MQRLWCPELLSQPQGARHCAFGGLVLAQGGIWNATGSPYGSLSGNVIENRPGSLHGIFIEPVNKPAYKVEGDNLEG